MAIHRARKIRSGIYVYRGFEVHNVGYIDSQHHNAWEAVDEFGCGFAHSGSLRVTKKLIDDEIEERYDTNRADHK